MERCVCHAIVPDECICGNYDEIDSTEYYQIEDGYGYEEVNADDNEEEEDK